MKYTISPPIEKIDIPEKFKIACWISNLNYVHVLQSFVDHVTMFDLYWRGNKENFTEVANTLRQFAKDNNKEEKGLVVPDTDPDLQDYHTHYFTELVNGPLDAAEENREESYTPVTELMEMARCKFARKTFFKLDADTELVLSDDFCMFCEIYQVYPVEILEYFMGKISMEDIDPKKDLTIAKENHALIFFSRLTSESRQHL